LFVIILHRLLYVEYFACLITKEFIQQTFKDGHALAVL